MFDDAQEPKDMFADVPDSSAEQKRVNPQPQVIPAAATTEMQYSEPKSSAAGLRLVAALLISLACIGGAGYAAYRFMVKDAVSQQVSDVIGGTGEATDSGANGTDKTPNVQPPTPDTVPDADTGPTAIVDSDGDGLSNDEERIAGTSVAKPDTDGDGLGDREEVKKYETDPKKADTDGDGYADGAEVQNGYNPNGEGKLLEIPK